LKEDDGASGGYRNRCIISLGLGLRRIGLLLWQASRGIGPITRFDTTAYATRIAGEVKNFHPEEFIPKKDLRKMDPFLQLGLGAADSPLRTAD